MNGIEENLGRQTPRHGVRVVATVVAIPFVGFDRELINTRIANRSHQVADIKVAFNELPFEISKQLGNARRIASSNIIDRLDETLAEQVSPHSVYITACKIWIAWTG